jgi:hypothetical protein
MSADASTPNSAFQVLSRYQMVVARLLKHEVHVAWSVAMSLQQLQQLAYWPIVWYRVRHRHNRLEPKVALFITMHDSSLIGLIATRILYVVEPLAVRLPDIDLDICDWLAVGVLDGACYEAGFAVWIMGDLRSIGLRDGVVRVEGSQHSAFGAGWRLWVIYAVHEKRETKDVGEEDELLQRMVNEGCKVIQSQ